MIQCIHCQKNTTNKKFCSKKCKHIYRGIHSRNIRQCVICQQDFYGKKSKSCSRKCGFIYRKNLKSKQIRRIPEIGEIFNFWKVIKKDKCIKDAFGRQKQYWLCQCQCKEKTLKSISQQTLFRSQCVCCVNQSKFNNRLCRYKIGQTIGFATITSICWHSKYHCYYYGYTCVCNKTGYMVYNEKTKKSCKCGGKAYKGISGEFWGSIKCSAKNRKLEFNINIKEAWNLLVKQNFKCALSGIKIKITRSLRCMKNGISYRINNENMTASLDRIDSTKGYILSNIQWVHKDVNSLKMDLSEVKLYEYCKLIYLYNKNKYECQV